MTPAKEPQCCLAQPPPRHLCAALVCREGQPSSCCSLLFVTPGFLFLLLHFLCNLVLLSPASKVLDCGALTSIRSDLGWRMSFPFHFSRQLELKHALLNC
ncbi:hypothetical protein B0H13DRAFT_1746722, partial [Mycena leptocephala]